MPTATEQELAAIRDLYARSIRAIDDSDADAYAETFTESGRVTLTDGQILDGRDALKAWIVATSKRPGRMRHFVRDVTASVDADTASGAAHVVAVTIQGAEVDLLAAVTYLDRFVLQDGGWRTVRRVVRLLDATDLPDLQTA